MIYYIMCLVSLLQKIAKALHTQMKQAFPDRDILVYITNHDEQTAYHDISERFRRRFKPFKEDQLLDRREKERAAWIDP